MNATSSHSNEAGQPASRLPGSGRAEFGRGSASAMSMKWSALHDAAAIVASIASTENKGMTATIRNLPAMVRDAGGWRQELAETGIEDLNAIMEPGLSALLSAYSRGANPRAAAVALLEEFGRARDAIMALAPPQEGRQPRRFT